VTLSLPTQRRLLALSNAFHGSYKPGWWRRVLNFNPIWR
jgi:hypothetical protein